MRRGQHAADDGSFGKSAAVHAGRAAILIVVALVIGIVLLQDFDDVGSGSGVDLVATPDPQTPDTSEPLGTVPSTTTLPVRAPRDVKVLAINATTVNGAAGRVSNVLRQGGYNVLAPVDASPTVKSRTTASAVYYATQEFEREARRLQQDLALPPSPVTLVPTPPPTADLRGANVVIVVGPDLAQSGTSGATSTTARGASGATTTTAD